MGYLLVLTDILQTEPDSTDQNSKSVLQCFNLCVIYFNRHKLWCNTVSVLEPQTVYKRWLLGSPLSSLSIMKADISYRDQNFPFSSFSCSLSGLQQSLICLHPCLSLASFLPPKILHHIYIHTSVFS